MEEVEEHKDLRRGDGKSVSIIGANITVNGSIEASGDPSLADLQIEGKVMGDIRCATVVLVENSAVTGNIYAERVRISGSVEGGIDTNDLAIEATARVGGDVCYDRLRIAAGGVIQGTMKWKGAEVLETARLKLVDKPEPPKAVFID
jgi:cytoskeletal protein CcmA (bactofilin family)